jgi:hypothetical protein
VLGEPRTLRGQVGDAEGERAMAGRLWLDGDAKRDLRIGVQPPFALIDLWLAVNFLADIVEDWAWC